MPELKHTFTGGKMDKDNDERIVANGQYREALNIQVATSEGSDIGAAQNILGNLKQTLGVSGPNNKYTKFNNHIAHVVDVETDNVYKFTHTPDEENGVWMDRITEFNTEGKGSDWQRTGLVFSPFYTERSVMVDIYKVRTICTGFYQGPCDQDAFLDFTVNVYQIRWGMLMTTSGAYDIFAEHGIYIKGVEILDDGSGSTPASIRCRINVNDANANSYYDPSNPELPFKLQDLIGQQVFFHGDRNLNFHTERPITGINILDGMLFWTDNYSEPKKINIKRAKEGSTDQTWDIWRNTTLKDGVSGFDYGDFDQHTRLVVDGVNPQDCIVDNDACADPVVPSFSSAICGCTIPSFEVIYWKSTSAGPSGNYTSGYWDTQVLSTNNYDPTATLDDGSCVGSVTPGRSGSPVTSSVPLYSWQLQSVDSNLDAIWNAYQASGLSGAANVLETFINQGVSSPFTSGHWKGAPTQTAPDYFTPIFYPVGSTPIVHQVDPGCLNRNK